MRIETLLKELSCPLPEGLSPDTEITGVVYDSRKAAPGCAFVCLRGARADGHQFAPKAAQAGAAVIVAEEPVDCNVPVVRLSALPAPRARPPLLI
mgnify:CR=1 FL=1